MTLIKIIVNGLEDVYGSVWLATAIMAYEKYLIYEERGEKIKVEDFAFGQTEIQQVATKICKNTVQNARISQWCNADHSNNLYNYLREVGKKRRLTALGEFNNEKEIPLELLNNNDIVFEVSQKSQYVTFGELVKWVKICYSDIIINGL